MADRTDQLTGKKIAFLVANEGVEEAELSTPWDAVIAAGGAAELIATDEGTVQCFRHLDRTRILPVDHAVGDVVASDYDALVLPGGVANADELRTDHHAVRFVRDFVESGKPTAVICHGPWILADAGVLQGRTLTSWPSLKTDLHNGARTGSTKRFASTAP